MKKVLFYLLGTLVLAFSSCSSGDSFLAQMGQASLRNVWHSDCQHHTMTRNTITEPTRLRLTYHEDTQSISGEYLDFRVNCAYTDAGGKLLSKKYLSDYKRFGRLTMPMRMTDINYGEGKDSSVVRTLYSSVKVDVDDPAFSFQVPADATPMKLPEASR